MPRKRKRRTTVKGSSSRRLSNGQIHDELENALALARHSGELDGGIARAEQYLKSLGMATYGIIDLDKNGIEIEDDSDDATFLTFIDRGKNNQRTIGFDWNDRALRIMNIKGDYGFER